MLHPSHRKSVTKWTVSQFAIVRFVNLVCVGMLFMGCTQANNTDIATSKTALVSDQQDQAPQASEDLVYGSGIDVVYADTDGNGVADRIERCGPAICIYPKDQTGQEGPPTTYRNPDWMTVSIEQVQDLDNLPGTEVIVTTTKIGGRLGCVCVITDRNKSVSTFADPAWYSATIDSIHDTNGEPGQEIVLMAFNEQGQFHCLCILHPSNGSYDSYSDAAWKTVLVRSQEDTDGLPGKEIILDVRDAGDSPYCICVVHDRSAVITTYQDSTWNSREINSIVDTDGLPGAEIVVVFHGGNTAGVVVIHDQTKEMNAYQFADVVIETVSNRDNLMGSEICVRVPTSEEHFVIRDRTKEEQVVEMCA